MEKRRENEDPSREALGENFHAEMPAVVPGVVPEEEAARGFLAPPNDPDGYVGPEGRARPHDVPAHVAEHQDGDRGLDAREIRETEDLDSINE